MIRKINRLRARRAKEQKHAHVRYARRQQRYADCWYHIYDRLDPDDRHAFRCTNRLFHAIAKNKHARTRLGPRLLAHHPQREWLAQSVREKDVKYVAQHIMNLPDIDKETQDWARKHKAVHLSEASNFGQRYTFTIHQNGDIRWQLN